MFTLMMDTAVCETFDAADIEGLIFTLKASCENNISDFHRMVQCLSTHNINILHHHHTSKLSQRQ
jgi:hypothetical protein